MNIIFDIGNTFQKYALFEGKDMTEKGTFTEDINVFAAEKQWQNEPTIISSVKKEVDLSTFENRNNCTLLHQNTSIPIHLAYDTPSTLGKDRIANACGAYALYPYKNTLIIDCGTCINYELQIQDTFIGGLISPGLQMRFKAMHHFTNGLPLFTFPTDLKPIGKNTQENMQYGVVHGIVAEINHHIRQYIDNYNVDTIILTGGDAKYFEKHINYNIFVIENLTLIGLNEILLYQ